MQGPARVEIHHAVLRDGSCTTPQLSLAPSNTLHSCFPTTAVLPLPPAPRAGHPGHGAGLRSSDLSHLSDLLNSAGFPDRAISRGHLGVILWAGAGLWKEGRVCPGAFLRSTARFGLLNRLG